MLVHRCGHRAILDSYVRADMPRLTIGLPVRNGGDHLAEALDSLLAQTYADFDLVVSDNASDDDTQEIVQARVAYDARVRYMRRDDPVGAAENFDRVLAEASGELFAWAAHDDIWEPLFLERLIALLDAHQGAALAFCDVDNVDERGRSVKHLRGVRGVAGGGPRVVRLIRYLRSAEWKGRANAVYGVARTEALRASGGLRAYTAAAWGQDFHLLFKVVAQGAIVHEPTLLFHKRLGNPDGSHSPLEMMRYVNGYRLAGRDVGLRPLERVAVAAVLPFVAARLVVLQLALMARNRARERRR
jgi:GT2 family glycosyltransferase